MATKIKNAIGTILSVIGFFGLFIEAEDASMQLLWTSGAVAVMLIGYSILCKSGALERK